MLAIIGAIALAVLWAGALIGSVLRTGDEGSASEATFTAIVWIVTVAVFACDIYKFLE